MYISEGREDRRDMYNENSEEIVDARGDVEEGGAMDEGRDESLEKQGARRGSSRASAKTSRSMPGSA